MFRLEAPVVGNIRRNHPHHGVAVAQHQVALQHLRQLDHLGQEMTDCVLVLRLQPDTREQGQALADLRRVEHRHVMVDHPGLLQQPHPPQARRGRQPDLPRQVVVRHPPVTLQRPQDTPVDVIQHDWHPMLRNHSNLPPDANS
jgi:hypothetical protein